jgi:DNA-binding PadR family transcriptional regulator
MGRTQLGEVEQWVLLAVLRLGDDAFALDVLRELDREAGHVVSRGSLYRTLERLEGKGLSTWELEAGGPARGGHPRRRFTVTPDGIAALRDARSRLIRLWTGVETVLEAER